MPLTIRLVYLNGEEMLFPDWDFRTPEPPQIVVYRDKAFYSVGRRLKGMECLYQECTTLTIEDEHVPQADAS